MKKLTLFLVIILQFALIGNSQTDKKGQFPEGVIYGLKGAFKIDAPNDWVLDNKSGVTMGLPCVLYIDGESWQSSPVIMYSKIAAINYENIDKFIKYAINEFEKEDPNFYHKELETGEIEGKRYVIMDYRGGPYGSYERVFYIQMKKAVGYVVFSARNEKDFKIYSDAVFEVVESYEYAPAYIDYKEKN